MRTMYQTMYQEERVTSAIDYVINYFPCFVEEKERINHFVTYRIHCRVEDSKAIERVLTEVMSK